MVMYNGERRIDCKSHQQVIQEVVSWGHSAVESFAIHANLRDLIDVSRSMKFNLALRNFFIVLSLFCRALSREIY